MKRKYIKKSFDRSEPKKRKIYVAHQAQLKHYPFKNQATQLALFLILNERENFFKTEALKLPKAKQPSLNTRPINLNLPITAPYRSLDLLQLNNDTITKIEEGPVMFRPFGLPPLKPEPVNISSSTPFGSPGRLPMFASPQIFIPEVSTTDIQRTPGISPGSRTPILTPMSPSSIYESKPNTFTQFTPSGNSLVPRQTPLGTPNIFGSVANIEIPPTPTIAFSSQSASKPTPPPKPGKGKSEMIKVIPLISQPPENLTELTTSHVLPSQRKKPIPKKPKGGLPVPTREAKRLQQEADYALAHK